MNFINFYSVFYLVFYLAFHLAAQLNVVLEALIMNDDVERVNVDHFKQFSDVSEFEELDNLIDSDDEGGDTDLFVFLYSHLNGSSVC